MTRRTFVAAFFSVAALLTSQGPSPLAAQEFPSRTIRIISPFPPGAGPDVMIRILGESLSAILKQPVVIEAKPGGSGIPAMEAIKSAPPDGHVLGLTSDQNLTILPHINPSIPYDPKMDFTPVSRILSSSYFVLVASKGPYSSLKDLIADARSAPRKVSFGTQAVGSQAHLGAALFGSLIGAEMVLVPYRDMSQLFLNIGNGDVGWVLSTAASASAFLQNGTIKPLAIAQRARSPQFPDVPTVAEAAGFEFESAPWLALVGPRGLPPAVVAQLNAAVKTAVAEQRMQDWLRSVVFDARTGSPEDLRTIIADDLNKNAELVKRIGPIQQ